MFLLFLSLLHSGISQLSHDQVILVLSSSFSFSFNLPFSLSFSLSAMASLQMVRAGCSFSDAFQLLASGGDLEGVNIAQSIVMSTREV